MKPIAFTKMNGSGNDFVIIDNRAAAAPPDLPAFIRGVCRPPPRVCAGRHPG